MAKECQNLLNPISKLPDYLYIPFIFYLMPEPSYFLGEVFAFCAPVWACSVFFPASAFVFLTSGIFSTLSSIIFFESSFCSSSSKRMLLNKKLLVSKY